MVSSVLFFSSFLSLYEDRRWEERWSWEGLRGWKSTATHREKHLTFTCGRGKQLRPNRAAAVQTNGPTGVLCSEGASAKMFPTPFQSLKIEKFASKMKKNWDHKHERHRAVQSFPDILDP